MRAVAEAPSKVIITGEHFVVHGAWALAAAVDRRVRVEVGESPTFSVVSDRFWPGNTGALAPVREIVGGMAREFSFRPTMHVSIASDVPQGSGLGSSASTAVALVSAVSKFRSVELDAKEVARFAGLGEKVVHGNPSGIDASTCAHGGVILYRIGNPPRRVSFEGKRRVLVAFSGEARSTKRLISRVRERKEQFPSLFGGLVDYAGKVSMLARERLVSGQMKALGGLLTLNHAMLTSVGVSGEPLDTLVDLLISLGCYGAKLTGAGGGGSVVAVAPRGKEKNILSGLKGRGYEGFVTALPVEGVRSWLES
jgi:mevalonate kinase